MQYLWGFLSGISLITVLSLISVSVPGLANQVSMYLLSLAQMNIIPANEITDLVLDFDDMNDNPLNGSFMIFGYGETNIIRNLGATFLYLVLICLMQITLLALDLILSFIPAR